MLAGVVVIILSGIAARIALKLMSSRLALGPKLANLIGHAIVAAVMAGLIYLAYCWAWDRGRDHEGARWEAAAAKIEAADAKADAAGAVTAAETKGKVDAGNERAKQAAAGSDDPLAAGFDSLRKENQPKGD